MKIYGIDGKHPGQRIRKPENLHTLKAPGTVRPFGKFNTSLNHREKELLEFYARYDPKVGYNTALVLGALLGFLILYLFYRAKVRKWIIMFVQLLVCPEQYKQKRKATHDSMTIRRDLGQKPRLSILKRTNYDGSQMGSHFGSQLGSLPESQQECSCHSGTKCSCGQLIGSLISVKVTKPDDDDVTEKPLPDNKTSQSRATASWVRDQPLEIRVTDTDKGVYLKVQTNEHPQHNSTGNVFSTDESSSGLIYLNVGTLPMDWNKSLPTLKDPSGRKIIVIENAVDKNLLNTPTSSSYLRAASSTDLPKHGIPESKSANLLLPPTVPTCMRRKSDSNIESAQMNTLTPKSVTINEASNSVFTLNSMEHLDGIVYENHVSETKRPGIQRKSSSQDTGSSSCLSVPQSSCLSPEKGRKRNHLPLSPTINITTFDFSDNRNRPKLTRTQSMESISSNSSDTPLLVDVHTNQLCPLPSDNHNVPVFKFVKQPSRSSLDGRRSSNMSRYSSCSMDETVL